MFGAAPASPYRGDPRQLALFQNFSFTYFPSFRAASNPNVDTWSLPDIPGFQFGNPENHKLMVWNKCFGMTTVMTPVDSGSFPLPTRVLYQWEVPERYRVVTDRVQFTDMSYRFNPQAGFDSQVALLYGVAPSDVKPPPFAGSGYVYDKMRSEVSRCDNIGIGQQPPDWARIAEVQGKIHAVVTNNRKLCPNEVVTIISVLFPPSQEYPQGRYLWTWYSPFSGSDGTHSRPVTFMESASQISVGTSLALADYFGYQEFGAPIDPSVFALPSLCQVQPPPATPRRLIS